MKWLSWILMILVVSVTAAVLQRIVLPQLDCNREKAIVNAEAARLRSVPSSHIRNTELVKLRDRCRRCLSSFPNDYQFEMLHGYIERLLGNTESAERSLRRSLSLCERPETLAYLGLLQLESGRTEDARKTLFRAAIFNLGVVAFISEPLKTEITVAVEDRRQQLIHRRQIDAR